MIEAATDLSDDAGRHLWAVGVDSDFVFELPAEQREHVLTSMLKRLDLGVERIVEEFQAGELEVPGSLRLGLADEAVGYSTAGDHLSPATIAEVDGLAADIASGVITVSTTPTGDLRKPPPSPEAPDTPESRAALDVANRYFAAVGAGDIDTAMALLGPHIAIDVLGPWSVQDYERLLVWDAEDAPQYVDVECVARLPARGLTVECTYGVHPGMTRRVGAPVVRETSELVVHDGAVTDLRRIVTPADYAVADGPFNAWMEEHHPDDAEVVECCGWPSLDEARRTGALRARYGEEWAAYLEEKGCAFDEGC